PERSGLKLLQSGFGLTLNVKASAGSLKSFVPSIPTLIPRTFSPGLPAPLKIGSLIGSWKLSVPTRSGRRGQARDAPQSKLPAEPAAPMSTNVVVPPPATVKNTLSPPDVVPR